MITACSVLYIILTPDSHTVKVYFHQSDTVEEMDFEEYIVHVLAAEMPASFESEALKAQSVAARTYALQKMKSDYNDPYHKGADVCTDSSHCQAYNDMADMEGQYVRKLKAAVSDTSGKVITYDGELIRAVFHSAAHGYTERSADVWGGDIPYLQSVASPWDTACPNYIAEASFSEDEIRTAFSLPSDVPLIGEIARSGAGGVTEINLAGKVFKGTEVRSRLNLRSTCFTVTYTDNEVTFRTEGYGHGVGMSQWGAQGMALDGYTYGEILTHYYTGTQIKTNID